MKRAWIILLAVTLAVAIMCLRVDDTKSERRPQKIAAPAASSSIQPGDPTEILNFNWQELRKRKLRLLPVPKQIRFTNEKIVLAGKGAREVVIVLTKESERARIAAGELVSRMRDFSVQREIPILPAHKNGAYNIVIENEWPNTFTRDGQRPAEAKATDQAYGLYPASNGITVAGQGEMGMMYAAVTLRYLMAEGDGKVVLYPASVIDWPDYKNRHMGTLLAPYHMKYIDAGPAKHLENMSKYIDWLFRMKANGTFRHTIGSVMNSSQPGQLPAGDRQLACAKAVSDYARKRGLVTMHNDSVALGVYPQDKNRPGFDKLMLVKDHGRYYSWARHDLHRNKARNMAEFCRRAGFDLAFIHAVDAGGILDPELWSMRDELTRQKYGDDRVQADVDMFNIYTRKR